MRIKKYVVPDMKLPGYYPASQELGAACHVARGHRVLGVF